MACYLVSIDTGLSANSRLLQIRVEGDSPEDAKRVCERAGLIVEQVNHTPIQMPAHFGDDVNNAVSLRDEIRQVRARIDVMNHIMLNRTGVSTVVVGVLLAVIALFGLAMAAFSR